MIERITGMKDYQWATLFVVIAYLLVILNSVQSLSAQEPLKDPLVEAKEDLKVVYVGAKWCVPCRLMKPVLKEVRREGIKVVEFDYDNPEHNPYVTGDLKVVAVPTTFILYKGKVLHKWEGYVQAEKVKAKYRELREQYPPEPVPDSFPDTPVDLDENDSGLDIDTPVYDF